MTLMCHFAIAQFVLLTFIIILFKVNTILYLGLVSVVVVILIKSLFTNPGVELIYLKYATL